MNCDSYRRMLFLYRDGELTNQEAEELVRHLHSCERCRMEQERITRDVTAIGRLRSFTPKIDNPGLLASTILATIRSCEAKNSRPTLLESVLDFFALPGVRIAVSLAILLTVGTFVVQYMTLFADIRSLELTARESVKQTDATDVLYSVESRRAINLVRDADASRLLPTGVYSVSDGRIVVQRSDVLSFLSTRQWNSIASGLASSALHLDSRTMETLTNDVIEHTTIITRFNK